MFSHFTSFKFTILFSYLINTNVGSSIHQYWGFQQFTNNLILKLYARKNFQLKVIGCPEFSKNILETIFTKVLRKIEGWKFVTKDYLLINLEGKWVRRYCKFFLVRRLQLVLQVVLP